MISISRRPTAFFVRSFGASCRGPLHRKEGRPNEDAWLRACGSFGSLVVVCDGIGSRPKARRGAQAACRAVREAVVRWAQADDAPIGYLIHLIEVCWRIRIHPASPGECATTCLWALARNNGEWVMGALGDGLLLYRTGQGPVSALIGEHRNGFGNETVALGASSGVKSWKVLQLPPTEEERLVVLATDGIADDLVPEKYGAFCSWISGELGMLEPSRRWRLLMAELEHWPTPKHLDDKTLAVLHGAARGEMVL